MARQFLIHSFNSLRLACQVKENFAPLPVPSAITPSPRRRYPIELPGQTDGHRIRFNGEIFLPFRRREWQGPASPLMRLSVSVSRVSAKCCWADSEGKHLSCLYVYERDVKATYFALGPLVSATTHFRICGEKNWREIVFAQPAPAPPLPSPPLKAKISLRPPSNATESSAIRSTLCAMRSDTLLFRRLRHSIYGPANKI